MMVIVIFLYFSYVGFNVLISKFIFSQIRHSKYYLLEENTIYSTLVLFLGVLVLLFKNRIKHKRMEEYLNYWKSQKKYVDLKLYPIQGVIVTDEEMNNLERYLKIKELKKKSKNNLLWV